MTGAEARERLRRELAGRRLGWWYRNVYLFSAHWHDLRNRVLRVRPTCEVCGRAKATQVHHIEYRSIFDVDVSDLQAVCRACHQREHGITPPKQNRQQAAKRQKALTRQRRREKRAKRLAAAAQAAAKAERRQSLSPAQQRAYEQLRDRRRL